MTSSIPYDQRSTTVKYAPIDSLVSAIRIPDPSDRAAWGEFLAWSMDHDLYVHRDKEGAFLLGWHDEVLSFGAYLVLSKYGTCTQVPLPEFEEQYAMMAPKPPFVREPTVPDVFDDEAQWEEAKRVAEPPTEALGVEGGFLSEPRRSPWSYVVPHTEPADLR